MEWFGRLSARCKSRAKQHLRDDARNPIRKAELNTCVNNRNFFNASKKVFKRIYLSETFTTNNDITCYKFNFKWQLENPDNCFTDNDISTESWRYMILFLQTFLYKLIKEKKLLKMFCSNLWLAYTFA